MNVVQGVEPYESAFRNTLPDIKSGPTVAARWRARRELMAFMRENVLDFFARWPHLRDDFVELLHDLRDRGRGGPTYQANIAAMLEVL